MAQGKQPLAVLELRFLESWVPSPFSLTTLESQHLIQALFGTLVLSSPLLNKFLTLDKDIFILRPKTYTRYFVVLNFCTLNNTLLKIIPIKWTLEPTHDVFLFITLSIKLV